MSPPVYPALDFWKINLKKWSLTKSIFGLFQTLILQATQAVKIEFEKYQKLILLDFIFWNWFFKNQMQINSGWHLNWNDFVE